MISKTLNPLWGCNFTMNSEIIDDEISPLIVKLFDIDKKLLGNTMEFMG